MAKFAEQFGREIRSRRKLRGLTQAALGEASGLSEEWVRRIERGTGSPSFEALEAMAAALGCPVADLFSEMTSRDEASMRIEGLLARVPERDLVWIEELIRVAIRHP